MKPNQFMAINNEVIVKIIIFLDDLNNIKKFLISLKKIRDKKSTKKDQTPLCIATSKEGMYFISSKKSGWGIPHQIAATQAKIIPLVKLVFKLWGFYVYSSAVK